jgi:heme exporter protein A
MLQATGLSCLRGERELFAGVEFSLSAGAWLHVTGNNGVGKTSLLRMLCGLSPPAAGSISWKGTPIPELGDSYRAELCYLGHQTPLKEDLTASENLRAASALKGRALDAAAATRALERMELGSIAELPVRYLSQGHKRRVGLAHLIATGEPLWVLDEPLAALDAAAVASFTQVMAQHLASGGIAVLTGHHEFALPPDSRQHLRIAA